MSDEQARPETLQDRGLPAPWVGACWLGSLLPFALQQVGVDFSSPMPSAVGNGVHVLLQWIAICIALTTAFLALLSFHIRADLLLLTVGLATLAAALTNVLPTLVLGSAVVYPADPGGVVLSWSAGRAAKPLIFTLGTLILLRPAGSFPRDRCRFLTVAAVAVGLTVAYFSAHWLTQSLSPVGRPASASGPVFLLVNVVALGLYLLTALVVFPFLYHRRPDIISHSLLLSTVPDCAAQLHMAFGSRLLHDSHFNIALGLNTLALLLLLAGVGLHFVRHQKREVVVADRLAETIARLEQEVAMRERTEQELRSKELRLRQLTDNIREVFWICSPDGSHMFYVSPAYEDIFRRSCDSLYQDPQSYLEAIHPEDRERVQQVVNRTCGDFSLEYRIVHPDEAVRWIRTRAFSIRNDQGEVYRLAGVSEDVTEQKFAESELRRSEARNQALLDAIPDLMFRLDRHGVFMDYQARDETLLLVPPEDFLGKRVTDVFPKEFGSKIERQLRLALGTGATQLLEFRLPAANVLRDFEARFVVFAEDEVLVIVRDITDQKRLEREILEVSNREQQRIGHDLHDGLSQQLAGVALLVKALHQRLSARRLPEAEDALGIAELVKDAVAKTRSLARGLSPVHLEVQGLPAALQELAESMESLYKVECRFQGDSEISIEDHAVATHLYRIAQEAVANAVRHAEAKKIVIGLERRRKQMRLSVSDDGKGIAEAPALENGMGMHIMKYRARMIDGTLDVQRAGERGTLVTCAFPIRASRKLEVT